MFEVGKFHQGLTYEQYAAQPGLRASDLRSLRRSPAHWVAAQAVQRETTDALAFGNIFHKAMENPEKFLQTFVVEPKFDRRTTAGKVAYTEWHANSKADSLVVKADWAPHLVGMLGALRKHGLVSSLLKTGIREVSLWVDDDETGELLKCRPDFVSEKGFLVDIKTARSATYASFHNALYSSRWEDDPMYVLQAAHYSHCARLTKLCRGDSFVFVAIEKEPPYGIMVYTLDSGAMGPGEQWRSHLTKVYSDCRKRAEFPCYPEPAIPIMAPEWAELPITG